MGFQLSNRHGDTLILSSRGWAALFGLGNRRWGRRSLANNYTERQWGGLHRPKHDVDVSNMAIDAPSPWTGLDAVEQTYIGLARGRPSTPNIRGLRQ